MATNTNVTAAVAEVIESEMTGKKWYLSKTFWANVLAAAFIGIQMKYGMVVPAEYQMMALTGVNLALRKITKDPVVW